MNRTVDMSMSAQRRSSASARLPMNLKRACIVLLGVLIGIPTLVYPFGVDQGIFAVVADSWLRGGLPYRSAWDVKPPAIFLVYAAAQSVFGHSMAAPRAMDLLFVAVTSLLVYGLVRRSGTERGAVLAGLFYPVLYFGAYGFWDTAQTEGFAAPLIVGMVWLSFEFRRHPNLWRAVAAGACLGAAICLKTTFALEAVLALAIVFYRNGKGYRAVAPAVLGALIVPGLFLAYYAAQGALPYLSELLRAQLAYAKTAPGYSSEDLDLASLLFSHRPVFLVAMALGLFAALRQRSLVSTRLAWLWAAVAFGCVVAQRRYYDYHSVVLVAPMAILLGEGMAHVSAVAERRGSTGRIAATAGLAGALLLSLLPALWTLGRAFDCMTGALPRSAYLRLSQGSGNFDAETEEEAARAVAEHAKPGESSLVLAFAPTLMYESQTVSLTRHINTAAYDGQLNADAALMRQWRLELLRDCQTRPPKVLVVIGPGLTANVPKFRDIWPSKVRFCGHRYTVAKKVGVYRICSLAPEPPLPTDQSVEEKYRGIRQQAKELGFCD